MSRKILFVFVLFAAFLSSGIAFAWSDLEGGDHGNTAWEPANGTYIAGRHWGITTFSVPSGRTVYVRSHSDGYGWLSIHAQNISVQGTINGNYAGYPGGAAGAGGETAGRAGFQGSNGTTQLYSASYFASGGFSGTPGTASGKDKCGDDYYSCGGGGGGPGGGGGYREAGCKSTSYGWQAYSYVCTGGTGGAPGDGGQALPTVNGGEAWIPYGAILSDTREPMKGYVYKGSGGGGGGGPGANGYSAYSLSHNEAGGSGGGAIMLWATNTLNMGGSITSQGASGGDGAPGGYGYYPGCTDCRCTWVGCFDSECKWYYYGGSSIGGGGGSGGGVSIGAGTSLQVGGSVNISGGNGGRYTGTTPIRQAGKGSGGIVRLHADSPTCTGACTAVASGSTCSGTTMTAEVWNSGSTPAPGVVKFTAEDNPSNYIDIKVKVDGVEYTTNGESGFTVRMAYGQIYQIELALYQSDAAGNYKYIDMKFPDNRQVTGTTLSVLYNGGSKFRLNFRNLDSIYWTGLSPSLMGSKPQCVAGDNLWSNPCNWADGEGNVLAAPPALTDDIMFTNCAAWPLGYEPRINSNAKAASLGIDEGCDVYWAAGGGDLTVASSLQIAGGTIYSATSTSRITVGGDLYLAAASGGSRGSIFLDNVSIYASGNIYLGSNTDFAGSANANLIIQGDSSSIINESDNFIIDYLNVAKNSGQTFTILSDIGQTAAGTSSTIKEMETSSGIVSLADHKIGIRKRLVMKNSSKITGDSILAKIIVRGHDASLTPIYMQDSASIDLKRGSILIQPDIDAFGQPVQVPVSSTAKAIHMVGSSSLIMDDALVSITNNLADSGWNMLVEGSAVLKMSNSSYLNVDRSLTISSPNAEVYSSNITTGYETVGNGTLTLSAASIKIDYPNPWTALSSRLRSYGNLVVSSTINGQGPEFYVDGSSAGRSTSITSSQPLYKLFASGGQVSFAGDLTIKKHLEVELDGELMLSAGNRLIMQNEAEILVKGKFTSAGSVGNNAIVTSDATTSFYSFEVTKGEINSTLTTFEYMNQYGLQIKSDGIINATSALNRCTFQHSDESNPFAMITISNSQTVTCNQVAFLYSSGTPDPDQYNVAKTNNQGSLVFTNEQGNLAGEAYDDDFYNRVNWTLGNPTLSYYDVQNVALNGDSANIALSIILTGQPENTEYLIQNMSSTGPHSNMYLKPDGTFTSDANTAWANYLDFGATSGLNIVAYDETTYRFRVKARAVIAGVPQTPLATWDESQPAITTLDRTAPATPGIVSISEASDATGKYLNLTWSAVSGATYVAPMRDKNASGEYWPVNGFFDGFTDFNYNKDPQWAVNTGRWEAGSQVLALETGYTSGSIYFQGYSPGINYLYHMKVQKISGTNGVQIPFLYRNFYPCWKISQNVSGVMTSSVQGISTSTSKTFSMNNSQWYDIKILVLADYAYGYVDNLLMWSSGPSATVNSGSYLFMGVALENTLAYFDNITLKPLVANVRGTLGDTAARDLAAPTAPSFGLSNVAAASFKTIRISWDAITDQGTPYSFHLDALDNVGNYSSGSDNSATVTEGFGEVVARARVNDDQPDVDANYDNGLATSSGTFADMTVPGTKPGNSFRAVRIQACDAKATNRNCTDWLGRADCAGNSDCTGYTGSLTCSGLKCDYNTRPPGIPRYTLAVIPGNDASNTYPAGIAPTAIIKTGTDLDEDSIWVEFTQGANTAGTQYAVAWHSASSSEDCANTPSHSGWISTSYNPLYGYGSSTSEAWFSSASWQFDDDAVGSNGLDPAYFYCFATKARNGEGIETPLTPWSIPVRPPYKPRVQSITFGKGQEALGKPMLKVNGSEGSGAPSGDIQTATIVIEDKSGAADISTVLVRISNRAAQDPLWNGSRGYFEWNRDTGVFQERLNNQNLGGNKYVAISSAQCSKSEAGNTFTATFAWTALAGPDFYGDAQDNGISVLMVDASGITTSWTENQYGETIAEVNYTFHVSSQPGEPTPFNPGADGVDFWTNDRTPSLTMIGAQDPNTSDGNYMGSADNVWYKFSVVDSAKCDGTANTVQSSDYIDVGNGSSLSTTWEVVSNLAAGRYYWCGTAKDQHDYSIDAGTQPWERATSNAKARMIGIDFTPPLISGLAAYTDNPSTGGTSVAGAPSWIFDRTLYFLWNEQQPGSGEPASSSNRSPFKQYWYKLTNHFEGITNADTYPYPGGNTSTERFVDMTTGEGVGYGIKYFCVVGEDEAGNVTGFGTKTALCVQLQIDMSSIAAPVLTSSTHGDEAVVYCTDTSIDGSSVVPNTIPNAYEPEFTIADPASYSGIYGYSFSLFDTAGRIPDKCNSGCGTWSGFEDTLDPGLPANKCNASTLQCKDSDMSTIGTYDFHYAPASATVTDLQRNWKYNLYQNSSQTGGTYYLAITAYTVAGKWSAVDQYRYNVCACEGNDCKDYQSNKAAASAMVDFSGGKMYAPGSSSSFARRNAAEVIEVAPFSIDAAEVTNEQYLACMADGACDAPQEDGYASRTRSDYLFDEEYKDFPVLNVTWDMAQQYCTWQGKRLPSEVEWEFAAQNSYTGLDTIGLTRQYGNDLFATGDTALVYENHGPALSCRNNLYNMFNNVSEWVADWYAPYEAIDYSVNPEGPQGMELCFDACMSRDADSNIRKLSARPQRFEREECYAECYRKVTRGGSFDDEKISGSIRNAHSPDSYTDNTGFRCAMDAEEIVDDAVSTSTSVPNVLRNNIKALSNGSEAWRK